MIVCTRCGFNNDDGSEFCGSCGRYLEWSGQRVVEEAPPPEPEEEELSEEERHRRFLQRVVDRVREVSHAGGEQPGPGSNGFAATDSGTGSTVVPGAPTDAGAAGGAGPAGPSGGAVAESLAEPQPVVYGPPSPPGSDRSVAAAEGMSTSASTGAGEGATVVVIPTEPSSPLTALVARPRALAPEPEPEPEPKPEAKSAGTDPGHAALDAIAGPQAAAPEAGRAEGTPTEAPAVLAAAGGEAASIAAEGTLTGSPGTGATPDAAEKPDAADKTGTRSARPRPAHAKRESSENEQAQPIAVTGPSGDHANGSARGASAVEGALAAGVVAAGVEAGAAPPDAGAVRPETGALKPDVGAVKPDVGAVKPDVGAVKPDLGAVKPDARSINQQARPPTRPSDEAFRPARRVRQTGPTRIPQPGDVLCGSCGLSNDPARHFCGRCGSSLEVVPPPPPRPGFWQRLWIVLTTPLHRHKEPVAAGERPGWRDQPQPKQEKGSGDGKQRKKPKKPKIPKINKQKLRLLAGLVVVAAVVLSFVGPFQSSFRDAFDKVKGSIEKAVNIQYVAIVPSATQASSALPSNGAALATDQDTATYWATRVDKGVGQTLTIDFAQRETVAGFSILTGDQSKGTSTFDLTDRPSQVRLIFSSGKTLTYSLQNSPAFQEFKFSGISTRWLRVEILGVFPGKQPICAVTEATAYTRT